MSDRWLLQTGESQVIELNNLNSIKVNLTGGQINMIAHDEPTTRIEVTNDRGRELKVECTNNILEIDHSQLRWENIIDVFKGWNSSAQADVTILAPRAIDLRVRTISAEILISGFTNNANLKSISGGVIIDNHEGDVIIGTISSDVSASNYLGRIKSQTVSGDLVVTGDIRGVSFDTVSGDLFLDATGTPTKIETNSVSGNLTLRTQRGDGARYRVNTVSGTVLIDDETVRKIFGKPFERIDGVLSGNWLDLATSNVSGTVAVVHSSPSEKGQVAPAAAAASPTDEQTTRPTTTKPTTPEPHKTETGESK